MLVESTMPKEVSMMVASVFHDSGRLSVVFNLDNNVCAIAWDFSLSMSGMLLLAVEATKVTWQRVVARMKDIMV